MGFMDIPCICRISCVNDRHNRVDFLRFHLNLIIDGAVGRFKVRIDETYDPGIDGTIQHDPIATYAFEPIGNEVHNAQFYKDGHSDWYLS